jgi:CubicO group peptidase (beta-lactamase class C family)
VNRTGPYIFLVLILLATIRNATGQVGSAKDSGARKIIADFEQQLKKDVQIDTIGSISATIFMGDKIVWSKGFGKADNQKGIDADTASIYRIGSISKTVTAYLLMLMVQRGTLSLDEPVAKYLPEIKQVRRNGLSDTLPITFRQLASHTSGLAREPDLRDAATGPIEGWENKVLSSIPASRLITPPGKKYSYSNIGFGILGLAISRAAQKPFIDLVEENVFRPMQMTSSFYIVKEQYETRIAAGYERNPLTKQVDAAQARSELAGRGYKVPNGGIFTTANDLARFIMALDGNSDKLEKKYKDMMETIQTPESRETGYGFGLSISKDAAGNKIVGHDGAVAGFISFMAFNPESRIGVILLRNSDFEPQKLDLSIDKILSRLVNDSRH